MFETELTEVVLAENRKVFASLGFKPNDEVLFDQISEWRKRFIINDSHADVSTNILFKTHDQYTEYTQTSVPSNHLPSISGSCLMFELSYRRAFWLSYFGYVQNYF